MTLHPVEFRRSEDLESSFETIRNDHADALITFSGTLNAYAKRVAERQLLPGCRRCTHSGKFRMPAA